MKLTLKQLQEIRTNISDISIPIDWCNESGDYSNERESIDSAKYYIDFDLNITGQRQMNNYTFMEEPEWRNHTYQKEIFSIDVWGPSAEKVELSDNQKHLIELSLLSNIYPE